LACICFLPVILKSYNQLTTGSYNGDNGVEFSLPLTTHSITKTGSYYYMNMKQTKMPFV